MPRLGFYARKITPEVRRFYDEAISPPDRTIFGVESCRRFSIEEVYDKLNKLREKCKSSQLKSDISFVVSEIRSKFEGGMSRLFVCQREHHFESTDSEFVCVALRTYQNKKKNIKCDAFITAYSCAMPLNRFQFYGGLTMIAGGLGAVGTTAAVIALGVITGGILPIAVGVGGGVTALVSSAGGSTLAINAVKEKEASADKLEACFLRLLVDEGIGIIDGEDFYLFED